MEDESQQQSEIVEDSLPSGYIRVEVNYSRWDTPMFYTNLTELTAGVFGEVCSAIDTRNEEEGEEVAIKKLYRPFQSCLHAKRTYRELVLLQHLEHDNVMSLLDCFSPDTSEEKFQELYIVTQSVGSELSQLLSSQGLGAAHAQFVAYQVFRGLKYIHSLGIIHRDLTPACIAVREDCSARIVDFGLARQADDSMDGYVATRWYRAPEIISDWMHGNPAVDVWSIGCIIAEMITGETTFRGIDHIDQLQRIMAVTGPADENYLRSISTDSARKFFEDGKKPDQIQIHEVPGLADSDECTLDLLEKIFVLDCRNRLTVEGALTHPYFEDYHDPDDEPVADEVLRDKYTEDKEDDEHCELWRLRACDEVRAWRAQHPYGFDDD